MKALIRKAAREDILRQFEYYLEHATPDAAFRFLESVERSIVQLLEMPGMGREKPLRNAALTGLRVWSVENFEEMKLYYQVHREDLRIVRILHGRRDVERILEDDALEDTYTPFP
jgi:toxin ParE1/3/4